MKPDRGSRCFSPTCLIYSLLDLAKKKLLFLVVAYFISKSKDSFSHFIFSAENSRFNSILNFDEYINTHFF